MRIAMFAVVFLAAPVLAQDKDKPAVKEIPTKDLKLGTVKGGKVTEPTEVKTADDLAKSPVLAGVADEIKKQVNFEKEKLVVFSWGGSGGDKLATDLKTADKKTTATFTYTPGLTRDFRMHTHLYVVPKDAEVKVVTGK